MNITLIGMPGCGKSTIGLALARSRSMRFVDVDRVIIQRTGHTLAELIRDHGDDGFREIENRINASLEAENTVFAPGGSVIYGGDGMRNLRRISRVIYLRTDRDELLRRLGDLKARGVSIRPGQTFDDMMNERVPFYEHWAHDCVDTAGKSIPEIIRDISRLTDRPER